LVRTAETREDCGKSFFWGSNDFRSITWAQQQRFAAARFCPLHAQAGMAAGPGFAEGLPETMPRIYRRLYVLVEARRSTPLAHASVIRVKTMQDVISVPNSREVSCPALSI
jgi:hypothetical protein